MDDNKYGDWSAQKIIDRQEAFDYAETMALSICSYDTSAGIRKLLEIISTFRNLSVANALIIYGKSPMASEIGTSKYWNEERGTKIKKGEKGFDLIIRGNDYIKADGTKGHNYNAVKYFDISQTYLSPADKPNVMIYKYEALRQALAKASGIVIRPIRPEDDFPDNVNGLYYPMQSCIVIRNGLTSADFFMELAVQVALSAFDHGGNFFIEQHIFDAKCVAFLICSKWNVDTNNFVLPNTPDEYMEMESADFIKKIKEIKREADKINMNMFKFLQRLGDEKAKRDIEDIDEELKRREAKFV